MPFLLPGGFPCATRPPVIIFCEKVSCHGLVLVVVPGDTHPVVEVRHDARRASLWCVLKRLSEPPCETLQSLGIGRSAARVLRHSRTDYITVGVMSSCQFRSPVAPVLPCNFGGASNVLITRLGFQDRLLTRMDTPADTFEERVCSYPPSSSPISPRSTAHVEQHLTCARRHPEVGGKEVVFQ